MSIFKCKQSPQPNEYDSHLKYLLTQTRPDTSTIIDLVKKLYLKNQTLCIYPKGEHRDQVLREIEGVRRSLLYEIEKYDRWWNEVVGYINQHFRDFSMYGNLMKEYNYEYPATSHKIIENVVSNMIK